MKKIGYACLFSTLCLAFTQHVTGQQKHTAAEMACNPKYTKYYANQTNMELFGDFVNDATCKDSIYREAAYQLMMHGLFTATKWKDALNFAVRFENDVPTASKSVKIWFYRVGLDAAASLNDAEKVSEYRQKLLAIDPRNASGVNLNR